MTEKNDLIVLDFELEEEKVKILLIKGEGKKKNQIRLRYRIYKIPSCRHLPLHSKKKKKIGLCCVAVRSRDWSLLCCCEVIRWCLWGCVCSREKKREK